MKGKLGLWGMPLVLLSLFASFGVIDSSFLSFRSLTITSESFAPLFVVAAGLTLVFILGEIDLSIASTASLASVVTAVVMRDTQSIGLGVAAGIGLGMLVGAFNGLAVARFRLPAFVLTLSSMLVVRAIGMIATGGYSVGQLPLDVLLFGRGKFLGVSHLLIVAVFVLAATTLTLLTSSYGRKLYLVGTNERAAAYSGVQVVRTKFLTYLFCGALAGLAGVMIVFRLGSGGPVIADNLLLMSIAAVVLGGTGIYGGSGSTAQTAIGAGIIAVLTRGLDNMGLTFYDQSIILGAVIIFGSALSKKLFNNRFSRVG